MLSSSSFSIFYIISLLKCFYLFLFSLYLAWKFPSRYKKSHTNYYAVYAWRYTAQKSNWPWHIAAQKSKDCVKKPTCFLQASEKPLKGIQKMLFEFKFCSCQEKYATRSASCSFLQHIWSCKLYIPCEDIHTSLGERIENGGAQRKHSLFKTSSHECYLG